MWPLLLLILQVAYGVATAAPTGGHGSAVDPTGTHQHPDTNLAAVRFASALGSSMVLQQAPASAQLWGTGPPNGALGVTVQRAGQRAHAVFASISVTIGPDGSWLAKLPPVEASSTTTFTVTAKSGASIAVLTDIVFGDVFVCGGQVCTPCFLGSCRLLCGA